MYKQYRKYNHIYKNVSNKLKNASVQLETFKKT